VIEELDCLIIGGGPAGLTAAVYLGRFRRRVLIVDGGWSRAEWISRSHNLAGFPQGVAGSVFLAHMRDQAMLYGAPIRKGYVSVLQGASGGKFTARLESGETVSAKVVILATGVVENKPPVPHFADAVKRGLIRTCPICDGYENMDKRVAVLGNSRHAAAEALFLRSFTAKLSLLMVSGSTDLSAGMQEALNMAGIMVRHVGSGSVKLEDGGVTALSGEDGQMHRFDVIYTAFGTTSQTALARSLGAQMDDADRLYVDAHQETSVSGLFAAGDLVRGLNQISVANGEAAIAATAVHNRLPKSWPG
jgi:thioredoxin reductase (NADPH)